MATANLASFALAAARWFLGTSTASTLSSDAFTYSTPRHVLDTQAAAATDDLVTINGGVEGACLSIQIANSARNVVIKTTGNIVTPNGMDITLDVTSDKVWLEYNGSAWVVTSVSLTAAGGGGLGAYLASVASGKGASLIGIADALGIISSANVEDALQEVFGRVGPWTAIDLSTGTVSQALPASQWTHIRIRGAIRSSQAVTDGTAPVTINAESTATSYQLQNSLGTNNAANANEANSNVLLSYTGSTAPSGELAYNEILIPKYRGSTQKKMINLIIAYARSATDLVMGQRQITRVAATSGAITDAITTWGYILPGGATHHADSWLEYRGEN